jgi:hypothetical protein
MRRWYRQVIFALVLCLGTSSGAWATIGDPSFNSTNYQVVESEIGGNGQFQSASSHYNINPNVDDGGSSLGESAVGNSVSSSYQTNSGFNTTAQPGLTMIVNTALMNFGVVPLGTKTTASGTFSVKDYTSSGYIVQIIGNTPTNGGHSLTQLATDTAYNATNEQFGCNLVSDTGVGTSANPVQNPPGFGYGVAGDGSHTYYTLADQWRFNSAETIASSPKTSGETDYTMTCMINAINTTPGGTYTGALTLVTTGTF